MSDDSKRFAMDVLRREFVGFMNKIANIPGAPVQKQQAFLRFDEGHMWMQNAIMTYAEPVEPPPAATETPKDVEADAPSDADFLPLSPEEQAALPLANPEDIPSAA